MKQLNGAGTRLLQTIRDFTVAQRTIAIIGVAVFVLGAIALGNWMGKPTMSPLFTGLSASDASGVVAVLEKDKVAYELDGTGTILVPEDKVSQERLNAAAAGLPSNTGAGYALLDKMGLTASEFQQNATYKRAIEGELAKTIGSMQGVTSAAVMLAIPQQTVFTDNTEKPTASVTLNLNTPLTATQVQAITHLVSASYPGLTDSNVNVVDTKGDVLSAIGGGGAGTQDSGSYESATQARVQAMLDKVLGPGKSTVTVAADVSSSSGTTTKETYTVPSAAPVIAETTNDSSYTGSGAGAAGASGVLGTDTTDTSATTTGGGAGNTYTQKAGSKQNAVDKETSTQTIVPGTLNRQSIAVAVDNSVLASGSVSLPALQKMVSDAAGVNATRGDTISVTQLAFSNASAQAAAKALKDQAAAESSDQMMTLITRAVTVVGVIAAIIVFFTLLKKLFKRPEGQAVDGGVVNVLPVAPAGDPMYAQQNMVAGGGMPGQLGYGMPQPGLAPTMAMPQPLAAGPGGFNQLQADVDALAGADPERTAEYLRALMADGARV